jgi:hypothetical protein
VENMRKPGLSGYSLKLFALCAMLADHIAWVFVDKTSFLGMALHFLGAMSMPIFAFFVAQGYLHTRNVASYGRRLAVFALLSYFPFVFFAAGALDGQLTAAAFGRLNMIYTLGLGLAALWVWNHVSDSQIRFVLILGLGLASLPGDGAFFPVLLVMAFGLFRNQPNRAMLAAAGICLAFFLMTALPYLTEGVSPFPWRDFAADAIVRLGQLAALALLTRYNGLRGRGSPWLFYIFYPAHLLILSLILWLG